VRALLDWKTSRTYYSDQLVQVAAMTAGLWNELHPRRPSLAASMWCGSGRTGVTLPHMFFPRPHRKADRCLWAQFLCFREAYDLGPAWSPGKTCRLTELVDAMRRGAP